MVFITESRHTTDKEIGIVLSRFSTTLVSYQTGHTPGQCGSQVTRRHFQRSRLHRLDGTDHTLLLLSTECHYHHLVNADSIFFHLHIDTFLVSYHNLLCLHSQKREYQCGTGGNIRQSVLTVHIGSDTVGRTLHHHGNSRQRFTGFILNHSFYNPVVKYSGISRRTTGKQQQG